MTDRQIVWKRQTGMKMEPKPRSFKKEKSMEWEQNEEPGQKGAERRWKGRRKKEDKGEGGW